MKFFYSLFFATIFILFFSCKDYTKNKTHQAVSDASIKAGKKLAAIYCASCHQLPDPSLLDSKTWETGVLPAMGPNLGIFAYGFSQYPASAKDPHIGRAFYPSQPVVSFVQWQNIIDYYSTTSPDSLYQHKKYLQIKTDDKLFQPVQSSFQYENPATTFVKFQPGNQIIICDAFTKKLYAINNNLHVIDSINTNGSVTDIITDSGRLILCNTGILNPNNGKFGSVETVSFNDKSKIDTLFKDLMRPVQINHVDLNNDGKKDFIICEFGNLKGALSWLENKGNNQYQYHIIRPVPGAIRTYIDDYNHDGLPDIWALFAQGNEGIFLFTNKGNGVFDTKEVLQFPPSYGSSSFELDDFNEDGFPDIVYTCGDNADFSQILKPYHGVYIFLNNGKNNFTQKYFYPIHGCYKAIAKDFDGDGDLDIATISFFADYAHKPEEGFVYLKNEGDFKFQPYSFDAAKSGRWLTMDAADFDGDGKIDLVLGNFSVVPMTFKTAVDWTKQPPFLILKNIQ